MTFRILVERSGESGRYLAWCPDLPGCTGVADSRAEAIDQVRRRIADYFRPEPLKLLPGLECEHVEL
jgi:predicted RNase H-like HicB family nuclease